MDCECKNWAIAGQVHFIGKHHPTCPSSDIGRDAADVIRDLVRAMEWWGHQEDGIPEDCWEAYAAAKESIWESVAEKS